MSVQCATTDPLLIYLMHFLTTNAQADAGKFLTGFTAVAAIAIPSVLAHAKVGEHSAVFLLSKQIVFRV